MKILLSVLAVAQVIFMGIVPGYLYFENVKLARDNQDLVCVM